LKIISFQDFSSLDEFTPRFFPLEDMLFSKNFLGDVPSPIPRVLS
jgi:hypothetical protein